MSAGLRLNRVRGGVAASRPLGTASRFTPMTDSGAREPDALERPNAANQRSLDATVPAELPVLSKDKGGRPNRPRRTWPQRMLLGLNIVVILACFAAAGGLVVSRYYGNTLNRGPAPGRVGEHLRHRHHRTEHRHHPDHRHDRRQRHHRTRRAGRTARDVPASRPGGQQLPYHRRRQQRLHRPELALRRSIWQPREHGRTQRHDHDHARRPIEQAGRSPVVPPRPSGSRSPAAATTAGSTRRT